MPGDVSVPRHENGAHEETRQRLGHPAEPIAKMLC
jgi:hypothetical protein